MKKEIIVEDRLFQQLRDEYMKASTSDIVIQFNAQEGVDAYNKLVSEGGQAV